MDDKQRGAHPEYAFGGEQRAIVAGTSLEALFRQYVGETPLGILVIDAAGLITFANAGACTLLGYRPDELHGQPVEMLLPEALRQRHVSLREAYLQNPVQRLMAGRELVARRKDGTLVPVAVGLNPLTGDGRGRVACSILDLSELRMAQRELARFFDLSPDLFCIGSLAGHLLRVNPNFSRVLGRSDEETLSRPFLEFVHPEDVAATQAVLAEVATGRPVVRFRNRLRDVGGDYRWFEWSGRAAPEEGTFFATARDVTDQVRLEQELIARERRERAILDNTPAVVYVKAPDGRYEYVNQRYLEVFTLEAEAIVGRRDHDVFPAEAADQFRANDQLVLESGERITTQETVPQDDGPHTYVSTKFPLFDAHGKVAAVAGISTDVTEQIRARETQEQLRLARHFQKKLYPARAPAMAGLDVAGSAVPVAQVCGDCYDFIPCGPGRLAVLVADVSGHGIGPSLEMVAVRTMLRMLLQNSASLSRTARELNRLLCEDLPESSFVSLFLATVDVHAGRLEYVGAGHEAALLPAGGEPVRLRSTGPLLGIDSTEAFDEVGSVDVVPGDLFLAYTDGLTDAMNLAGQSFGLRRLIDVVAGHRLQPADAIIQNVFTEVYEFASGRTILDDMTVLAVKVTGAAGALHGGS